MSYTMTEIHDTYSMLEYLHDKSIDYSLFREGISLQGLTGNLIYKAKSRASFNRIQKYHLLFTTGPRLVSSELRSVLERIVPDEVEFFDARIIFENEELNKFSAINPIAKVKCCDMKKSEYELANFDPHNPRYFFSIKCC